MSIPSSVLQTVLKLLNGRTIVTFTTTANQDVAAYPVACLFASSSAFSMLPMTSTTAQTQVSSLVVYNRVNQRLETLDGSLCCFVNAFLPGILTVTIQATTVPLTGNQQFVITSDGQLQFQGSNPVANFYAFRTANLLFCSNNNAYCPDIDSSNVKLLNWYSLSDLQSQVGAVQDTTTLCCFSDDASRLLALFQWTKGMGAVQSVYPVYVSQLACQQADAQCACPTLRTCWMYNNTNVPCCIQGNPKDPQFVGDPSRTPVLITQDQNACITAAKDCSRWQFNKSDVPCCIQRSYNQWSTAQYDPPLQTFDNKADCDAAAASANTCNLGALLAVNNSKDYYGLILESQYVSGCSALNNQGGWASSTNCASDASPNDCYSGNCGVNYCGPWSASTLPYVYTQAVRCLPPAEQCPACPSGQQWVVSNPGTKNVTSGCK